MVLKTLYSRDQNKNVREWSIEVEGNAYRTTSGILGGAMVTSDWSYAKGKNQGKVNATTDEEQALKVAETLIRIRKEQGCYESISDIDNGKQFFQPMLASKWDARKATYPVLVQSKIDGIRLICNELGMWSRHGKEIISAPHIRKLLDKVFQENPDLILDGELYTHDLNNDFNKIISLVRKSKPTAEDLEESERTVQYWIYDIPSVPGTNQDRDEARKEFFQKYIWGTDLEKYFVMVESWRADSEEQVDKYLVDLLEDGYEGAIIRDPQGEYENKRSKNLRKYKKFSDEEFRIVRIEEGRGNLAGKAGRIVVDVDGKEVSAGLKFSHEDAQEIWEHRDYYVGKKATIKYFNKTEDGSLRFPKCIQIDRGSYE